MAQIRDDNEPIDVWLKFDAFWDEDYDPEEDAASHESNTFQDGDGYRVEWYLNAVGQVTKVYFDTYEDAVAWHMREGFEDYSS